MPVFYNPNRKTNLYDHQSNMPGTENNYSLFKQLTQFHIERLAFSINSAAHT